MDEPDGRPPPPSPAILSFEGPKPDHTKNWLYGLCSLSYLGAMVSSNSALQYVNYPTQVRCPAQWRQTEAF